MKNKTTKYPINQCDGCRRKLPLTDGIHMDSKNYPYMVCTKERYTYVRRS